MSGKLFILPADTEKVMVVGDLHGDRDSFIRICWDWERAKEPFIIFLGDYGDRGAYGLDIIESIIALRKQSDRVIPLLGNHEDYAPDGMPKFSPCTLIREAIQKSLKWEEYFKETLKPFFDSLFLAALLPGHALFVHGGVSSRVTGSESLQSPSTSVRDDVLWSDPADVSKEQFNPRGLGVLFGPDTVQWVLDSLGVKMIIRSHQPSLAPDGPCCTIDEVMTISSTRVYGGRPHYLVLNRKDGSYRIDSHFI